MSLLLYLPGFAIGGLFSLMSASFAYEDPLMRDRNATQKARDIFREMGKNMYSSGKGFAKVGALFAGTECVIEGVSLSLPLTRRTLADNGFGL